MVIGPLKPQALRSVDRFGPLGGALSEQDEAVGKACSTVGSLVGEVARVLAADGREAVAQHRQANLDVLAIDGQVAKVHVGANLPRIVVLKEVAHAGAVGPQALAAVGVIHGLHAGSAAETLEAIQPTAGHRPEFLERIARSELEVPHLDAGHAGRGRGLEQRHGVGGVRVDEVGG